MASKRMIGRKKRKPAQKNYVSGKQSVVNKRRHAQSTANKTHHAVHIKVNGEWEHTHPKKSAA